MSEACAPYNVKVEETLSETLMHVSKSQEETLQILREAVFRLYGGQFEQSKPLRQTESIREEISEILDNAQDIEKLAREIFRRL